MNTQTDISKSMESIGCVTFVLVVVPALVLVPTLLGGYVIAVLWGWFVVPTFHVAGLSYVQAAGLSLLSGYAFRNVAEIPKKDAKQYKDWNVAWKASANAVGNTVFHAAMTLALGWVIHWLTRLG